jgi:hypothetical protein
VSRDFYHEIVGLLLRQPACIDTAPFQEDQRCLNAGSLVAVEIGLTFGQMVSLSGGNFVNVAATVVVNVLGRRYSGLQSIFVPNAMKTAKRINLVFVNSVDDFA